jgi:phosphatidylcholine synthase
MISPDGKGESCNSISPKDPAPYLPRRRNSWLRCLGWCVHLYTALGLVAAAAIAVLLVDGRPEAFRRAFLLMVAATLIDATDGTFARMVRIKEVLPGFDGRRLDDLVDFLTYAFLPLLLIWRAQLLPEPYEVCLLAPLLASAYGFCQTAVKTEDGYFLGFPSYWNLVAFYLYTLQPLPGWFALSLVMVFALLTFVPSRYLYPSQRGRFNQITSLLGGLWCVLLVGILWNMPGETIPDSATQRWAFLSLLFPAWYLGASWLISARLWRRKRRRLRDRQDTLLAATACEGRT